MKDTESDDASEMRSLGMEEIGEVLDEDQLPVTTQELIDEHGDMEVEYPQGSEQLGSILKTSGEETYETVDEIELAILNGVGSDAVGREHYSDRGDETSEELDREQESL